MADFRESDELKELLASYVFGDLTPEEVATVNELLATYPELNDEVNRLQKTLALLPLALPETTPSPTLGYQILQAASRTNTDSPTAISTRVSRRPKALLAAVGSVAASVVIGFALYTYNLHRELVTAQTELSRYKQVIALLRQPSNRLLTFQGTDVSQSASGSLVIVPKSDVAVLSIQNLATLPQGQIYRLWAVVDHKKVYCGEFNPDSEGKVFMQMPLDNDMTVSSQALITVEPLQRIPQPTGETVMTGSISL